jgi:3-hydroxybutyryl-CoA dehydrogenase
LCVRISLYVRTLVWFNASKPTESREDLENNTYRQVTLVQVAVIGTGTMGRGIALTALAHGHDVLVYDANPALARGVADAGAALDRPAADGVELPLAQIATVSSAARAARAADVVIESIVEVEAAKAAVLSEIASAAGPETLLATNTSTISIARLGSLCGCEGRLIGLHFFNPVQKMRLVEIGVADGTPQRLVDRCLGLVRSFGKTPVVLKDSPGFITSRLGLALGNEAMRLVEQGVAEPAAIDAAMRLGYNHPMGPLELADLVGLDARLNNLNSLYPALGDDRYRPPRILTDLVSSGSLGRKSGRGFYTYDAQGRKLDTPG